MRSTITKTIVAFDAEVARYIFRNPHVTIFVETEDETGEKGRVGDRERLDADHDSKWLVARPIGSRSNSDDSCTPPCGRVSARAILNTLETTDGRLWSQVEGKAEVTVAASSLEGVWRGVRSTGLGGQTRSISLNARRRDRRRLIR